LTPPAPEPPEHSQAFRIRRLLNWLPMGLMYAMMYMGRYNLTVFKKEVGEAFLDKSDFGIIFGVGTAIYAFSFLVNGPLVDRIGGKRGILIGVGGVIAMNLAMGLFMRHVLMLEDHSTMPIVPVLSVLYGINMYFQSYGAVSIVKVNATWFHVRERGGFSGIFGTLIASGLFFAYDGSKFVYNLSRGQGPGGMDATWWIFFAPVLLLAAFWLVELFLLKDRPALAGHADFDTGDASSGDEREHVPTREIFVKILTSRVIMTVAAIEFCTGVLRQGIQQWFFIFASDAKGLNIAEGYFFQEHWGLLLLIAGIIGANAAGWTSDKVFGSRRAPAAGLLYLILALSFAGIFFNMSSPWGLGILAVLIMTAVTGTHGLLSGTATMDFGGRKGAATAVGLIDGFVYLGTAVQSFSLGYLTERSWSYWPVFLLPFSLIGFGLLISIWKAVPGGKKGGH
jgi:OPA family glycerol-3-phosphate transporter-like MFS transporter